MLRVTSMAEKITELGLDETVDAAGMDSFPASDPPSWAATHAGPPVTVRETELFHQVVQRLHDDVRLLCETIGERNDRSPRTKKNLEAAATAIEERFRDAGLPVKRRRGCSIEAVVPGSTLASESLVIGAHYDTLCGSRGADDNASGVAALLALARAIPHGTLDRTVRLVAFGREEPPHTGGSTMSSVLYAGDLARQGTRVGAMLSLEGIGRGDLALVGAPRRLLARTKRIVDDAHCGVAVKVPRIPLLFRAVRVASHLSFLACGVPAFLVTDRSLFSTEGDDADHLDYEKLGHTSSALANVVRDLAGA